MDIHFFDYWHAPMGVFTFVILIVLINGIFHWLRVRSQQQTLREAIKSGVQIDPEALKAVSTPSSNNDSPGGRIFVGLILIAVACALAFFGYQIGTVDGDPEVFTIFQGIAAFPGLIGVVFLISAPFAKRSSKEQD